MVVKLSKTLMEEKHCKFYGSIFKNGANAKKLFFFWTNLVAQQPPFEGFQYPSSRHLLHPNAELIGFRYIAKPILSMIQISAGIPSTFQLDSSSQIHTTKPSQTLEYF
jgi:hypothetical protein